MATRGNRLPSRRDAIPLPVSGGFLDSIHFRYPSELLSDFSTCVSFEPKRMDSFSGGIFGGGGRVMLLGNCSGS
eukprot:CAMPEP_0198113836 /NCGR_PEP_ID=MMETSP1442-20131203/5407_1 /TAXON_ID= /ORGANISM="Craspedostauros australis, Strain CCMP3328" /LENGTH=73 /DNA_ID=CAMNT_0043771029 /DNA_START=14 /DNA_END=235 /DNA_ORIENTATION=-